MTTPTPAQPLPETADLVTVVKNCAMAARAQFDDRPRLPDNFQWTDGYEQATRDVEARLLAFATTLAASPAQPANPAPGGVVREPTPEAIEALAEQLAIEHAFENNMRPGYQWPLHPDDDGYRGEGYVRLIPADVQAHRRDDARRILIFLGQPAARAALSAPAAVPSAEGPVSRPSDMDPSKVLRLVRQEDGDIIVSIGPAGHHFCEAEVEFCTSVGGTASPLTRAALGTLMAAMREDEARHPSPVRTPTAPRVEGSAEAVASDPGFRLGQEIAMRSAEDFAAALPAPAVTAQGEVGGFDRTEIERLRGIALAATPGDWHADKYNCYVWGPKEEMVADSGGPGGLPEGVTLRMRGVGGGLPIAANMAHVSAFSPATALRLLDALTPTAQTAAVDRQAGEVRS